MRKVKDEWTGVVVGMMHQHGISKVELAKKCGYSAPYISTVLNCKKRFESDISYERTRNRIEDALLSLIEENKEEK